MLVLWWKAFAVRTILLFAALFLFTLPSFGQEEETETYLIVRIELQNVKGNSYYTINAEPFNNHALAIYDLVPFPRNLFIPNKAISFYYNRPDTLTKYYNYFKSETEALDFMGSAQWQLVTVLSELKSEKKAEGYGSDERPYSMVSSRPVYYFRKKVAPMAELVQ